MTLHIQIDDLQNVNYLRSRHLLSLHEEFIYIVCTVMIILYPSETAGTRYQYGTVPYQDEMVLRKKEVGLDGTVRYEVAIPHSRVIWKNNTSSDNTFYRIFLFLLNTKTKELNKLTICSTVVLIFLILLLLS